MKRLFAGIFPTFLLAGACVGVALLICSDAGRYVTGVDLLVDGGMALP